MANGTVNVTIQIDDADLGEYTVITKRAAQGFRYILDGDEHMLEDEDHNHIAGELDRILGER